MEAGVLGELIPCEEIEVAVGHLGKPLTGHGSWRSEFTA